MSSTHCLSRTVGRFLLLALALACVQGCATKKYPVTGRVLFKDGTPLPGGLIVTSPVDPASQVSARGVIDMDGTFELNTDRPGDGSLVGKFRVVIMPLTKRKNEDDPKKEKLPIDPRYLHYETSGLEIEIKPEKNDLTIYVERPAGGRGKT